MAGGDVSIEARLRAGSPIHAKRFGRVEIAGAVALGLVLALTLGPIATLALHAKGGSGLGPADWAALRFTLVQALLSALISVALAMPVARALARRKFTGRALLVALMGAPFILPVIVAIMGLLAVFGRAGLINQLLGLAGLEPVSVYGLHGVVLAHVFFNLPLATRLILQGWLALPAEQFRLAAMLGFSARDMFRVIEAPMLRQVLPGAALAVFLLCLTSFAVALTLGGGPRATSLELAIYQAFRFDFDLGKAALLALMQFALGAAVALLALCLTLPGAAAHGLDRVVERWDGGGIWRKWQDGAVIALAAMFLLVPLALVVARGLPGLASLPPSIFFAALRSLAVALLAAGISLTLALALAALTVRRGWGLAEAFAMLTIAASPLVIGTGLFILLFGLADTARLALPLTALVNAAMSLPFCLRVLVPALREAEAEYGQLADQLALTGLARLRLLWLGRMRRALGFAAGLSAALSMGDLGVIALFARPGQGTLPMELYRLMGAYRMDAAAGAALLLLLLAFGLYWLFDRGGRVDADH